MGWEAIVNVFNIPHYILPPPSVVGSALVEYHGILFDHFLTTLQEAGIGFIAGASVAIPIAIGITYSRFLQNALYPLLIFAQTVPKVAIAPVIIIWLGFGVESKILLIILITVFPIVINTAAGLTDVDEELLYMARSMKATRLEIFTKIRLPNSLPYMFTGFKLGITLAVVGAVVGEFVGGNAGLGYLLVAASGQLNTPLMFSCILILALLGIALFKVVDYSGKKLMPWHTPPEQRVGGA